MFLILSNAWPLFLGLMLLMLGNGVQGTLLGIRGEIEGFSTFEMSLVMSGYFVGFLGGSNMAPNLIRRVGHVRVFAALGSMISAVLILYPMITNPWAWMLGRVLIGFCFSGVYVTAESWLNNAATNETRGKALSLYMIVQMAGIILAQALLVTADPSGYVLFIIPSVLVSLAFAPILLSISPTPAFESAGRMTLRKLFKLSPLGVVGMFLIGGMFAAQFGMAAVFATEIGLSVREISLFVSMFYIGALVLQYPLGWVSDRMDRRILIMIIAVVGGLGALAGALFGDSYQLLLVSAFIIGGSSSPLYSLLLAHTNDYLDLEDMASASGGLLFLNGVGAISGPLIIGWLMTLIGPLGFFLFMAGILLSIAAYAGYRSTQRAGISSEDTTAYTPVMQSSTSVAVEFAREYAIDNANDGEESSETR